MNKIHILLWSLGEKKKPKPKKHAFDLWVFIAGMSEYYYLLCLHIIIF